MISQNSAPTTGILLSGGVDSSILAAYLLSEGWRVRPFYIRCNLVWERYELRAVRRLLEALNCPALDELITLRLPVSDLYQSHWSVTGRHAPDAESDDADVYLPGRNALLVIKAALWCQLHSIEQLAFASLGTSPFEDATQQFCQDFQAVLSRNAGRPLRIVRPFGLMTKREVMQIGAELPLELSFSCISPIRGRHCGRCNKCAERRRAFLDAEREDPTSYHNSEGRSCIG